MSEKLRFVALFAANNGSNPWPVSSRWLWQPVLEYNEIIREAVKIGHYRVLLLSCWTTSHSFSHLHFLVLKQNFSPPFDKNISLHCVLLLSLFSDCQIKFMRSNKKFLVSLSGLIRPNTGRKSDISNITHEEKKVPKNSTFFSPVSYSVAQTQMKVEERNWFGLICTSL